MSVKVKSSDILTIPNFLSFIRIILVPVFAYFYFTGHYYYSGLTLIISGLTDVIDGFIARQFNMISSFGKIIDPFADKLTQAVTVVCLAIRHNELIPLLILFFAKEFSMLLGSVKLFKMGLRPSEAKWWGKMSTVIIYVLLLVVLISDIVPAFPGWVIMTLMVITGICIVFSLFNYYPIFKDIQSGNYDIAAEAHNKSDALKGK